MSAKSPKEECEDLMNDLVPFAKQLLADYGEFFPFGGHIDADGNLVHDAAKIEGNDRPKSQPLIDILRWNYKEYARNGECRATAIVSDVRLKRQNLSHKGDAIQISLDHKDNYSVDVYFPYSIVDGDYQYGEIFAQLGKDEIFPRNNLIS